MLNADHKKAAMPRHSSSHLPFNSLSINSQGWELEKTLLIQAPSPVSSPKRLRGIPLQAINTGPCQSPPSGSVCAVV